MVDLPSNMPLWDTVSSLFQLQPHPNTFLIFFDHLRHHEIQQQLSLHIIAHQTTVTGEPGWPHNFGGTWWDSDLNGELYTVFPQAAAGFRLWILASKADITDISWQFINGIAQLQRCTIFFEDSSSLTMSHSWVPWRAWVFKHLQNSANGTTSRCGISPLNAPDFLCEQRHKSQDKCLPYILFRLFKC